MRLICPNQGAGNSLEGLLSQKRKKKAGCMRWVLCGTPGFGIQANRKPCPLRGGTLIAELGSIFCTTLAKSYIEFPPLKSPTMPARKKPAYQKLYQCQYCHKRFTRRAYNVHVERSNECKEKYQADLAGAGAGDELRAPETEEGREEAHEFGGHQEAPFDVDMLSNRSGPMSDMDAPYELGMDGVETGVEEQALDERT